VQSGEQVIVGVNRYGSASEAPPEILQIDPRAESEQVERLLAVRTGRDAARAAATVDALRRDAIESANLMPAILDCVRAEVTLGEISNALREIYGEHQDQQVG
jgi:methylmalonyl-CoA mutase N-terminal domain/subunit